MDFHYDRKKEEKLVPTRVNILLYEVKEIKKEIKDIKNSIDELKKLIENMYNIDE